MHDRHFVESLRIEIEAVRLPALDLDALELERRLADFARGPALRGLEATLDDASAADEVWRLDLLELDLGELVVDDGVDWRDVVARALSRQLRRRLADLREAAVDDAARGLHRPLPRRRALLEPLMFFLRHGHMPWYGRGRLAQDPRELGHALLRADARGFVAALRAAADREVLLRRLAAQFDADWLAAVVRALLADEPAAAGRVIRAVHLAGLAGHLGGPDAQTRLWEAALAGTLAHVGGAATAPDVAVMRLQLQWTLAVDATSADDAAFARTAPAWRRLLRDDRVWLRSTLRQAGATAALQRRLAHALPTALLAEMAGLWLAAPQSDAVAGWIATVAAHAPARPAHDGEDVCRDLWEAALSHLWAGGSDAGFDGRRFALAVRERAGLREHAGARDDVLIGAPPALDGGSDRWLEDAGAWWSRLREHPDALREDLRQALRSDGACARRLARDWPDEMLLEAACLQWPHARAFLAATVASPPHDAATREQRWAGSLRQAYAGTGRAAFDASTYLEGLVVDAASAAGIPPDEAARRWHAATGSPAAEPAWVARIVAAAPRASDAGVPPPAALREPGESSPQPAPAPAMALPMPVPRVPREAAEPEPVAAARTLARRVAGTMAALASTIGRRLGRMLSFAAAEPADAAVEVDNAGLVLLGPWTPALFGRLGLLEGARFVDDAARARAAHLLQFAVDGALHAAPESRLVLNKLLCGLGPRVPLERRFVATAAERALVDELLAALVARWSTLGGTSIAGLRETFLQRRGRLERRDDGGWSLGVDAGPFDMLIDHLPWGYGMQKLSWMEGVLHVAWR